MEHHAPHRRAAFEGYYSKFDLDTGGHIALIICRVKNGKTKPYMVSFTYVPASDDEQPTFQREIWADKIDMTMAPDKRGFILNAPDVGFSKFHADSSAEYRISHPDFSFEAASQPGIPWSRSTSTPESWLVRLPLPLHWHVQSLAAPSTYTLRLPSPNHSPDEKPLTLSGTASVHQEKNWARSFPSAHMWIQARDGDRGICLAGGRILGLDAFLFGYRSPQMNLDFRPPLALRVLGWSPTMAFAVDWERRTFEISLRSWGRKVVMRSEAPKGTFFSLSAPFAEGHRENFLAESFRAKVEVQVFESGWFGPWRLVHEDGFANASLEFGGGFYPPAGSEERCH